jgi:hypothetical protein
MLAPETFEITNIGDELLFKILKFYGLNPGPIVPSTRKVYERKLLRFLSDNAEAIKMLSQLMI